MFRKGLKEPKCFARANERFIKQIKGQIRNHSKQKNQFIQSAYEQAVAQGLDIPSKPATDTDAWIQRRHQLDRQATGAVQKLLTPEEQQLFDRAFLGIMGVDLGGVGVDRSNYPPGFLGSE